MDAFVLVEETLLDPRLERTEIDAVRRGFQLREVQTVRPRQVAVAVRAKSKEQAQKPGRRPAHAERPQPAERPVEPWVAERAAAEALGELEQDLPVGALVGRLLDDRRRPAGDVPNAERREQQIDVVIREIPTRRHTVVGGARRQDYD